MFFYTPKNMGQSGGASRWRVCYQRGLPRLVFMSYEIVLVDHMMLIPTEN